MGASKQEFIEQRQLEELNSKKVFLDLDIIKKQLENEEIDSLEMFGKLKTYEKKFKEVLDICKKQALNDSELYEKDFELKGFKFEKKNGRAIYNFKGIKAWSDLELKKKEVEAKAKNAYNAWKLGNTSISEDGEVTEMPIVTYTSDVLSVKKI